MVSVISDKIAASYFYSRVKYYKFICCCLHICSYIKTLLFDL
jgi:hypothetical protein